MRKLLFLCLVLAVSAGAQVSEDSNWSHVKSLYQAGQPLEVQFSETGDLGPSSPTLVPVPDVALKSVWSLVLKAKAKYPDLEVWRDPDFIEIEELGDRGFWGDLWGKVKQWCSDHIQLAFSGLGIGLQITGNDGGCIVILISPPPFDFLVLPC